MISAVPAELPISRPVPDTLATDSLLLLQKPPGVALDSGVLAPSHTVGVPVMADGSGLIVSSMVEIQPAGVV